MTALGTGCAIVYNLYVTTYCDSHAHVNSPEFDADRDAMLSRAFEKQVGLIIEIACNPDDWARSIQLARSHPGTIFCALGIHPQECRFNTPANMLRLAKLLAQPEVCAFGEIGLDYARNENSRETQLEFLDILLELGKKSGKPLSLHCRNPFSPGENAYQDMFSALRNAGYRGERLSGVVHCFSGSDSDAKTALDMGFLLGINGTLTYPKNGPLRDICKKTGPSKLLLETDCPYLPPQSSRGKRNEPANIPEICAALASTLEITGHEVAAVTLAGAIDLFGLHEKTQTGL